jgi:hypothetical protein
MAMEADPGFDVEESVAVGDSLFAFPSAVHAELLANVQRLYDAQVWTIDACRSMEEWVSLRHGVAYRTARVLVKAAHVIEAHPDLAEALACGTISVDHLAPLDQLRDLRPDEHWLAAAASMSVGQLEAAARAVKEREPDPVTSSQVRLRGNRTNDGWNLTGKLTAEDGEAIKEAFDKLVERQPPHTDEHGNALYPPLEERYGQALVELATGTPAPEVLVTVHVDAATLAGGDGPLCQTGRGIRIRSDVARYLATTGRIQMIINDAEGRPIGIGRASRKVPPWLERQVLLRDRHCQVQGCTRTDFLHIHHIRWWSEGGETNLDNLCAICGYHHRMLHRHGWRLSGTPRDGYLWISPAGVTARHGPHAPPTNTFTHRFNALLSSAARPRTRT